MIALARSSIPAPIPANKKMSDDLNAGSGSARRPLTQDLHTIRAGCPIRTIYLMIECETEAKTSQVPAAPEAVTMMFVASGAPPT